MEIMFYVTLPRTIHNQRQNEENTTGQAVQTGKSHIHDRMDTALCSPHTQPLHPHGKRSLYPLQLARSNFRMEQAVPIPPALSPPRHFPRPASDARRQAQAHSLLVRHGTHTGIIHHVPVQQPAIPHIHPSSAHRAGGHTCLPTTRHTIHTSKTTTPLASPRHRRA